MKDAHILIVEDEFVLYDKLASILVSKEYSVDEYTPSVADAYEKLLDRKPDLVLLDINLQGKKTGIDLGVKLRGHFNVPFIYITDITDDKIFKKALASMPNLYLVKTKPFLNKEELLRHVELVLNLNGKQEKHVETSEKQGIFLFTNRVLDLRESNIDPNYREMVDFKDILLVEIDLHKNKFNNSIKGSKNYVRITTREGKVYFYNNSLTHILSKLPSSFIRVNRSAAVNFLKNNIKGKTNQSSITLINGETFYLGAAYREEVERYLSRMFST